MKVAMKLRISILATIGLLACALTQIAHAETTGIDHVVKESFLNLKDDLNEAAASDRILVIYFEQNGCSYCELIHKVNFADKAIVDLVKNKFDVIALNSLGSREVRDFSGAVMTEKEYAYKLGIQFSPMMVFYAASGAEIFRMKGYYKPAEFKAALSYLSTGQYKTQSFKEYAATNIPQVQAKSGLIDEKFLKRTDDLKRLANDAKNNSKGVALLFTQKQCASCVELHEEIFSDAAIVARLTEKYTVTRINVIGRDEMHDLSGKKVQETKLADALGVRYTPTIIFLDQSGKEIIRYESYLKRQDFEGLLKFVTTDAWRQALSFQDWLRDEYYGAKKL